jgi:hypothetical protein
MDQTRRAMMRTFLGTSRLLVLVLVGIGVMWACKAEAIDVYLCSTNAPCSSSTTPQGTVLAGTKNTVNIAGWTDGVITISSLSNETAQVEVNDTIGRDGLTLKGSKLTFGSVTSNYVFEVVALGLSNGPDLSAGPNYHVQGINQAFKRGSGPATTNVVTTRSFVRLNSTAPWTTGWSQQIGAVPSTTDPYLEKIIYSSSSFYGTSMLDEVVTDFNQPRDLKLQLRITANQANDYLTFSAISPASPLQIINTTSPGGDVDLSECDFCQGVTPPPPPPPCTKSSMLSTSCATTHSTMKAFGCPTCVYDDGQMQKTAKARMFVENNLDNLEQDLAKGGGEHLTALTALLDVPETQRGVFCAEASGRYRMQAQQGPVMPEQLVTAIQRARESRQISPERTQDWKQE